MKASTQGTKISKNTKKLQPGTVLGAILGMALLLLTAPRLGSAQAPAPATVISISSHGQAGNGHSSQPALSADGRFVAFRSEASNLVDGDNNGVADIFVHDRLSGEIELISIGPMGDQTNPPKNNPQISADGRFVVYESLGSLLSSGSPNENRTQVYVYDRLTGQTERVSNSLFGGPTQFDTYRAGIAADGRYVTLFSDTRDLVLNDDPAADLYFYDRLTGTTLLGSPSIPPVDLGIGAEDGRSVAYSLEDGTRLQIYNRVLDSRQPIPLPAGGTVQVLALDLSGSARFSAYAVEVDGVAVEFYRHDQQSGSPQLLGRVNLSPAIQATPPQIALSSDASALLVLLPQEGGLAQILRFDPNGNTPQILPEAASMGGIDLSADGRVAVYTQAINGVEQIMLDEQSPADLGYVLAGRATDIAGHPLALVTITDGERRSTRSDADGRFWFGGLPPGRISLRAEKDGYRLTPAEISLDLQADRLDLEITAAHDEVLTEAELDLGMPYSFHRGCPDPFTGCGGPFHGFAAGYCTDLVLDAYSWGVDFDIQFALVQDYRARPWHVYRWRDARDAHDMWRYFSYRGQVLDHQSIYQPGDIVFFDWDEDGEIDHVSIISDVDPRGRPLLLLDATGVIASNPSGLAAELPWEGFHERTQRGHARWSGAYEPISEAVTPGNWLQVAFSAAGGSLQLSDSQGRALSNTEREIPGGFFEDLRWEQTASILDPLAGGGRYIVQLSNPGDVPLRYHFLLQTLRDGSIGARQEWAVSLRPGGQLRLPLQLTSAEDGGLGVAIVTRRATGVLTSR